MLKQKIEADKSTEVTKELEETNRKLLLYEKQMAKMEKKCSGEEAEDEVPSGEGKVGSEASSSTSSSLKEKKPTTKRMCTVEFNNSFSKATGIGLFEMAKPKSVQ